MVASAAIAAALSALLSLPRMLLWEDRKFPLWYVEAIIFFGGFVLWAFVFAWHTEYTRRPVFTLNIKPAIFAEATLAGVLAGLAMYFVFDPWLRLRMPQDYPADAKLWAASLLFSFTFTQLFLFFAPFAWLVRLFRNEKFAMWLTVGLNVLVLALKADSLHASLPVWAFPELLAKQVIVTFMAIWFYMRGGILLVWWLDLLVEARHLFAFHS